jgi:prefoldin subunit 5
MALIVLALAVVPGCGGGPKPEDEERRKQELSALRLEMNQKITDLEKRFADVLQMSQNAKNALDDAKKMTRVTSDMLAVLTAQEQALKEYLRALQDAIKELKAAPK